MSSEFAIKAVALHNKYREQHGAAPLEWNEEMEAIAKEHAAALLLRPDEPLMPPKPGVSWGQNIFEYEAEGFGQISDVEAIEEAIQYWYEDAVNYDPNNSSESQGRNFSQLVWKSSKKVGMGVAHKEEDGGCTSVLVLAYYDPSGNFKDQFDANVSVNQETLSEMKKSGQGIPTGSTMTTKTTKTTRTTTTMISGQSTTNQGSAPGEIKVLTTVTKGGNTQTGGQELLSALTDGTSNGVATTEMRIEQGTTTRPPTCDGRSYTGTTKITTITTTVKGTGTSGSDLVSMISNLLSKTTTKSSTKTNSTTTITATISGVGGGGQDLAAILREALASTGFGVEDDEDESAAAERPLALCEQPHGEPIIQEPEEPSPVPVKPAPTPEPEPPKVEPPPPEPKPVPAPAPVPAPEPKVEKVEPPKPEPKPEPIKVEPVPEPKVEPVPEPKAPEPTPVEVPAEPEPPVEEPPAPEEIKIEPTIKNLSEEAMDLAAKLHNEYRGKHGAPSVKIIDKLCEVAQCFATNIIAKRIESGELEKSCPGINVHHSSGGPVEPEDLIKKGIIRWHTTVSGYNWRDPTTSDPLSLEFAQLAWAKSRSVGFAIATDNGTESVFVVVYAPPADYSGVKLFRANVRPDFDAM